MFPLVEMFPVADIVDDVDIAPADDIETSGLPELSCHSWILAVCDDADLIIIPL